MKLAFDLAGTIVAFDSMEQLSRGTRAAVASEAIKLVSEAFVDLADIAVNGGPDWEELHSTNWLPQQWRLVVTAEFFQKLAVAVVNVTNGLTEVDWEGPSCLGEELVLRALCERVLGAPEHYGIEDAQLQAEIDGFTDSAFQDADHEYLFDPASDGIDESEVGDVLGMTPLGYDAVWRPFNNRNGHPFFAV